MRFYSITKKVFMALTGLGLVVFLIGHLAGNTLLFKGAAPFNGYAHFLVTNPFLIPAEIGLLGLVVIHVWSAIAVTLANRAARPVAYAVRETSGASTVSSRNMFITGAIIILFVVSHILHFKYGDKNRPNGLWGLVVSEFQRPEVVAFYVLCMLAIGLHLGHAIGSVFQSLGLRNASGHPRLQGASAVLGWGLGLGFAVIPLVVFIVKPDANAGIYPVPPSIRQQFETLPRIQGEPSSSLEHERNVKPGVSWRRLETSAARVSAGPVPVIEEDLA